MTESTPKYWLMKAEPDSRVVKGKDVKFSVDDFESVGSTAWEGVRNYEARNLMKEMVLGDKILFYHSNCRNPGIAGFAEVSKEAYPDYTAWDSTHPYFDEKTDKSNPRWFMVNAQFISRAQHFVPLSLLRRLADLSASTLPEAIGYVGEDGINSIKGMPLITRGRLSVQRVSAECWDVIQTMADRGGWDNMSLEKKASKTHHPANKLLPITCPQKTEQLDDAIQDDLVEQSKGQPVIHRLSMKGGRKRKVSTSISPENEVQPRRSLRRKKVV